MHKIFLCFFLFFSTLTQSCDWKANWDVLVLSGPYAYAFERLGLINQPQVQGVSAYYRKKISSKISLIAGGESPSVKQFQNYKNDLLVFFDQSQKLEKNLQQLAQGFTQKIKLVKIKTQRRDPFSLARETLEQIAGYTKNCQHKIVEQQEYLAVSERRLREAKPFSRPIYFFMGKITEQLPHTLIVNDGFNIFWIQNQKIKTYASPLSFVNWSLKQMTKAAKDTVFIGLETGDKSFTKERPGHWNISHPDALVPGWGQVDFMLEFTSWFQNKMAE